MLLNFKLSFVRLHLQNTEKGRLGLAEAPRTSLPVTHEELALSQGSLNPASIKQSRFFHEAALTHELQTQRYEDQSHDYA